MKQKNNAFKNGTALCLSFATVACGAFGVLTYVGSNSQIAANAATRENVLIDFSSEDSSQGVGLGSLVTDVDADGDGTVEYATAWKVPLTDLSVNFALCNFTNDINVNEYSEIRLRAYIHWGTVNDPANNSAILFQAITAGGEDPFQFNTTYEQDKWTEIVWGPEQIADMTKDKDNGSGIVKGLSLNLMQGSGVSTYSDAVMYLESIYILETRTVTFVHGEGIENTTSNVYYNETASAEASKKEGYTAAWYTDEACTELFDFNTPITENITLYAKYTLSTYTVTFVHGGSIASEFVENVEHGSTVDAKEGKKTGYTVKWYTDSGCTNEYNFSTPVTGNLRLYARYTINTYTVTYYDGSTVIETKTVDYDATAPQDVGAKTGYTVKWYTDAACANEYNFATTITGDLNLYAKYTINTYTVTVVLGGDAADLKVSVNHGATADLSGVEKEGYTVVLYTDEAMTTEYNGETPVTGDITLYAKYTQIKNSGCGGEIGFGSTMLSVAVASVVIACALITRKKKEND